MVPPTHDPGVRSKRPGSPRPELPYACKGGVCSTCRARVVSGEVSMARNFALEPDEVAAGYVLTCQALPITDKVVVDYDA